MEKERKERFVKLRRDFCVLKNRIIHHRRTCSFWKVGKPCYDCHYGTLTKIEEDLEWL